MAKLGVELHENFAIFRVWAPFAQKVEILGDAAPEPIALAKDVDGVWSVKIADAKIGKTYKYRVTGADGVLREKNDPRARALTDSDNGWSVVASDAFDWGDDENFAKNRAQNIAKSRRETVIYELHLGTFAREDLATPGTFETATQKLDYLANLGVTDVELMPITSMAQSFGWGYAPSAIFAVESAYGGAFGLKKFVRECHKRGIGVVLDVVYNHFFPTTALWQFDGWSENGRGGIYFYNDARGDTPWGARPDYGRPEVRDFLLDNVAMWFYDFHIDGLRADSTIYMRNQLGHNDDPADDIPDAWKLLQDIAKLARKINPAALLIAEDCAGNAWVTKNSADGGMGFDAQWDLGLPHVIRDALGTPDPQAGVKNPSVDEVPDATEIVREPNLNNLANVLGQNFNGDFFARIIFADSHDTAANGGERIISAAEKNPHDVNSRRIAILSSAIALTAPGTPMILAGSEFLQGGDFNDWAALDWENVTKFGGVVEAHKHLIALRKNVYGDTPGLASNDFALILRDDVSKVLCFRRDETFVFANFSDKKLANYSFQFLPAGAYRVMFNSSWKGYSEDFSELKIADVSPDSVADLPPYVVLVLAKVA